MITKLKKLRDGVLIKKFIRYSIVGAAGAFVNVFSLWFFTDIIGIYYIISAVFAFIVSLLSGFFFQKYFTFKNNRISHSKQLLLFSAFQVWGLLIDIVLLGLLVDTIGVYYIYVSIFNKGIIFVWNFIMNHFFTFYQR